MLKRSFTLLATTFVLAGQAFSAVVHYDMTVCEGQPLELHSALPAFSVASPLGEAMRFDGYSTYALAPAVGTATTLSVVFAAETFPMMNAREAEREPSYALVVGNLDEAAHGGFALELSSVGQLRLRFGSEAAGGSVLTLDGPRVSRGAWHTVVARFDEAANRATLVVDGSEAGSCRMGRAVLTPSTRPLRIGKGESDVAEGPFLLNTFCGLIDDIRIDDVTGGAGNVPAYLPGEPAGYKPAPPVNPDFLYPASRYAAQLWRPRFHAMPSGAWTNETHGMTYSGGLYHLFFQKNANGPYMARLHWGHLASPDLLHWTEQPIAFGPDTTYDVKGCWSGCLYGQTAYYTAVDNARAVIATAEPTDTTLLHWTKTGIAVNGRPAGLSDDFRDPYVFEHEGQRLMIVGTSKDGTGCVTLHRLIGGVWTNTGETFFRGTSTTLHGTFWEMPNVTPLGDGRYLFTCTPQATGAGVRTLAWVGTIDADCHFQPLTEAQTLEMNGTSSDGYGLLSPTISPLRGAGGAVLLGIVPDKLPGEQNYAMGWAHLYSLPRTFTVAADGQIVQRPLEALSSLRGAETTRGRHIEVEATLTGGGSVRFLQRGDRYAELRYDDTTRTLTLDLTQLDRQTNGRDVTEVYDCDGRVRFFLDGSVLDVFADERQAFSARLFPTDPEADAIDLSRCAEAKAWTIAEAVTGGAGLQPANACAERTHLAVCLAGYAATPATRGLIIKDGRKYVRR